MPLQFSCQCLLLHRIASLKQGPVSFFSIASLTDASLAQCRGGHLAEGTVNARNAYQASRKAFGDRAGLTGGTASSLAECLIQQSKLDEAASLLDGVDARGVAQLVGIPDFAPNIAMARAEIAYRQRDYDEARKRLQVAIPVFSKPDAEPYLKRKLEFLQSGLEKHLPASSN